VIKLNIRFRDTAISWYYLSGRAIRYATGYWHHRRSTWPRAKIIAKIITVINIWVMTYLGPNLFPQISLLPKYLSQLAHRLQIGNFFRHREVVGIVIGAFMIHINT